jgi:hypothetical protein
MGTRLALILCTWCMAYTTSFAQGYQSVYGTNSSGNTYIRSEAEKSAERYKNQQRNDYNGGRTNTQTTNTSSAPAAQQAYAGETGYFNGPAAPGNVSLNSEQLAASANSAGWAIKRIPMDAARNFFIEASCFPGDPSSIFGFQLPVAFNWYNFLLDGSGRYAIVYHTGNPFEDKKLVDWTPDDAIRKDANGAYKVRLENVGGTVNFMVNGALIHSLEGGHATNIHLYSGSPSGVTFANITGGPLAGFTMKPVIKPILPNNLREDYTLQNSPMSSGWQLGESAYGSAVRGQDAKEKSFWPLTLRPRYGQDMRLAVPCRLQGNYYITVSCRRDSSSDGTYGYGVGTDSRLFVISEKGYRILKYDKASGQYTPLVDWTMFEKKPWSIFMGLSISHMVGYQQAPPDGDWDFTKGQNTYFLEGKAVFTEQGAPNDIHPSIYASDNAPTYFNNIEITGN